MTLGIVSRETLLQRKFCHLDRRYDDLITVVEFSHDALALIGAIPIEAVAVRGDGRGFKRIGNLIFSHLVKTIRDSDLAWHKTETMRSVHLLAGLDVMQFLFA